MSKDSKTADEAQNVTIQFGPDIPQKDGAALRRNVEAPLDENGFIDWRRLIRSDELYANKDYFEKNPNEGIPEDLTQLEDYKLCIKLGGIKRLAKMRGYSSVKFEVLEHTNARAVVKCRIVWSEFLGDAPIEFESVANATVDNCDNFALKFLESIAENRAFVRCVRNFLGINIVGWDEVDKNKNADVSQSASQVMSLSDMTPNALLKSKFGSFNDFKKKLRDLWTADKYKNGDVGEWTSFDDVPKAECLKLIRLLS